MENPWFGRKADGYVGGIASWQGLVVLVIGIGGGMACYRFLPHPINEWASAACALAFGFAFWFKYDPDTDA
jgi:hypothetical protein